MKEREVLEIKQWRILIVIFEIFHNTSQIYLSNILVGGGRGEGAKLFNLALVKILEKEDFLCKQINGRICPPVSSSMPPLTTCNTFSNAII